MQAVAQGIAPAHPYQLRDSDWLRHELEYLWSRFFADTPRANAAEITFAGSWRNRLGVISLSEDSLTSYIGINSLLSFPEAPRVLTTITIAHELVHYAHGFGSPLPRRHRHPHRGRVVERELRARGLREELESYQRWIDDHWYDFYDRCALNARVVAPGRPRGNVRETYQSQ